MRAFLDASEITVYCQQMRRTPDLNGLWQAEVRLASQYASISEGQTELIITANNGTTVLHAGPCWYGEYDGDANNQFTGLTSFDHRVKWPFKQMMDLDGDDSDPSLFQDYENAPDIMSAAITNNITNDGAMGIVVGSVTPGSVPLVGFKPTDFPWSLEQLWNFLVDTGELDVMLVPAAGTSTVDLYNGDAGSDLSGSVVFDYNTCSQTCQGAKYTFDMKNTLTRIRYFLGPKRPQYRNDIEDWAADVQKDDPCLPGNGGDSFEPVRDQICPTDPGGIGGAPGTTLGTRISSAESAWGLLREIRVYDSIPKDLGGEVTLKDLYYALWQSEMTVRTVPRRILQMTPEPGITPAFGVGDIITANAVLSGTVGGAQRVYSFTVEQDTEGNEMITQLNTSADSAI